MPEDAERSLEDISGVGPTRAEALRQGGYESVSDLQKAEQEEISSVDGIGAAQAARIKADVGDGEEEQDEEEKCPVCGEPFDHKRTESGVRSAKLRSDATQCVLDKTVLRSQRTAFVHLDGTPSSSTRVPESGDISTPTFEFEGADLHTGLQDRLEARRGDPDA
jgi:hypothetical protein